MSSVLFFFDGSSSFYYLFVGDCYVAASGVPVACADHAKTLVQVALAMLQGIEHEAGCML